MAIVYFAVPVSILYHCFDSLCAPGLGVRVANTVRVSGSQGRSVASKTVRLADRKVGSLQFGLFSSTRNPIFDD